MNIFNIQPENPMGDGGHKDRVADIRAQFKAGEITQDQFNDLMGDEAVTAKAIRFKRAAVMLLLATVGFFLLW